MFRKLSTTAAVLGLALAGPLMLPGQAQASPRAAAAPAEICGYNDNLGGQAVWINCGNFNHLIETWALGASQSFQCVAAHSRYYLGPTWFISSSKYAGGVGCKP
ncbi:hypothetical protein OG897_32600 [Streptomyces sp. NBC_00237]|uniref:hypothetical protein n=1 Tax=Streptomyces sp. NBC_00237 TaxID=2975687 RepID=UPI002257A09B|nr:hypothetical protein [Streptomyces sp. NBC_00237]MCX5206134.1 hypothetical protein [Streptomyces sp. NBC_00237]